MTTYTVIDLGDSRSFPARHPLTDNSHVGGDVVIYIGDEATDHLKPDPSKTAILIELGTEPLGVHTGESRGEEGSNMLGFARFRLGDGEPSDLVELVRQPATSETAIEAARAVFEGAGLQVSVCRDFSGRIVDRLIRPYYNAALAALDEGLASADDIDATVCMGLGYPEGPIALLERTGLAHHHDVTRDLFEVYGDPHYAPARRAKVAKIRETKGKKR